MKWMGKLVIYPVLGVNAFFVGMLVLSAYSPYLHPKVHPVAACLGLTFPIFLAIVVCFLVLWLIANYRYALLSAVGLLVCYPQIHSYIPVRFSSPAVPEESIKLLSYNVMGFNNMEKQEGKNAILTYLAESEADIICLQEYNTSDNKRYVTDRDVRNALKAYPYYSIRRPANGTSRLACFSKFPILSAKPIEYESTYNGSIAYTLKMGEDTIMLVNNHLESNKLTKEDRGLYEDMIDAPDTKKIKTRLRQFVKKLAEATAIRSAQADSINKVVEASPYPTIIACGDFNDVSISYAHRVLTQHLNDAFTDSGTGLGISYNQNKFYFRIDHILNSPNLKAYRCTVDNSIRESDHYPIWCYLHKQ